MKKILILFTIVIIFIGCGKKMTEADKFNQKGIDNYFRENYRLALDMFNQAISLDPSDAKKYNNRGLVNFCLGDYDNSLKDYNKALELQPDFPEVSALTNRALLSAAAAERWCMKAVGIPAGLSLVGVLCK